MLDEQARMELFSEAYVRALASRWGFDVVRHQTDKQSIDVQITTVGRHELRLLRCGYWTSLTGAEPTSNTKTITVELRNCLSVDELGRIMYLASEGEL